MLTMQLQEQRIRVYENFNIILTDVINPFMILFVFHFMDLCYEISRYEEHFAIKTYKDFQAHL